MIFFSSGTRRASSILCFLALFSWSQPSDKCLSSCSFCLSFCPSPGLQCGCAAGSARPAPLGQLRSPLQLGGGSPGTIPHRSVKGAPDFPLEFQSWVFTFPWERPPWLWSRTQGACSEPNFPPLAQPRPTARPGSRALVIDACVFSSDTVASPRGLALSAFQRPRHSDTTAAMSSF